MSMLGSLRAASSIYQPMQSNRSTVIPRVEGEVGGGVMEIGERE